MDITTPTRSPLSAWRGAVAALVLYTALFGLLWCNAYGPYPAFLLGHLTVAGVLECACGLTLATLMMMIPGYPAIKLVCLTVAAAYFGLSSGLAMYLSFVAATDSSSWHII